jgi:hypothetical protein
MDLHLAYATHRPETLPHLEAAVRGADALILEEPGTPGFEDMLAGRLGIDDYLLATDFEYPVFSRGMCGLARRLHDRGAAVLQVDPYMDVLAGLHERFAAGDTPADIEEASLAHHVYRREKVWFAALADYYVRAMSGTFAEAVASVQRFARCDALRGRLRDDLRAQETAGIVDRHAGRWRRVVVEAGYIHLWLGLRLRRRLPRGVRMRTSYLLRAPSRELLGTGSCMGPGDILTLRYTLDPEARGPDLDLLAARSLIRIKILAKEEMSGLELPHARDELECTRLTASLSWLDCEKLYPRLRAESTAGARAVVASYAHRPKTGSKGC